MAGKEIGMVGKDEAIRLTWTWDRAGFWTATCRFSFRPLPWLWSVKRLRSEEAWSALPGAGRCVGCMAGTTLSVFLLVAGVVAMLVLHILILAWALRRGEPLRGAAAGDLERAAAGAGLSAEELAALPCHERKAAGAGECAVCLEAFHAGDRCRALPRCEHGFHAQCVDPWLRKSRVCPVCRAEVVVAAAAGGSLGKAAVEATTSETATQRLGAADR